MCITIIIPACHATDTCLVPIIRTHAHSRKLSPLPLLQASTASVTGAGSRAEAWSEASACTAGAPGLAETAAGRGGGGGQAAPAAETGGSNICVLGCVRVRLCVVGWVMGAYINVVRGECGWYCSMSCVCGGGGGGGVIFGN